MKLEKIQQWNVKLKVTPQERKQIQKEAIDLDLKIGEYVKLKLLGDSSFSEETLQKKSAKFLQN